MTSPNPVWRSVHTDIDGALIDRDTGHLPVELTLEPMGRALGREHQTVQLIIQIGKTKTVLDQKGVDQLKAFLEEKP